MNIIIVGAGISGCVCANRLAMLGIGNPDRKRKGSWGKNVHPQNEWCPN